MSCRIQHMSIVAVLWVAASLPAGALRAASPPADPNSPRQEEKALIETLKASATAAEKDLACRRLRVIGTPACVPALAALLSEKDVSHIARYALEPMPYPEAGKALREALGKTTGPAKVGVINSLGIREDTDAVPELTKLLKDSDADIAAAAAAALGRVGTPEAAKAIEEFRASAPESLRSAAAEASLTAADRLLRRGRGQDAAKICEELQGQKWPKHVRAGALVGLLAARPDEAPSLAAKVIAGQDPVLRAVAVAGIATMKGQGVAESFAKELPKLPADVQVLLIQALADRGDPAVRPAIVAAASSASPEVRSAAAKALGAIGDASCVELLCKAVAEGATDEEKQAAAGALRRLRGEGVDAALVRCMKAAPPAARPEIIDALAERKSAGAVIDLLEAAKGQDGPVRAAALKAVGRLAEAKDLPAMLQLLVNLEDDASRSDAERAVAQVSRKIADEAARADAALAALKTAPGAPARCSLLRVLGGIGGAKAFEAVQGALTDKDAAVQDAAVRSLADWPDSRATEALLEVFRSTGNQTHRALAIRGCVRLLGSGARSAQETLKVYGELMKSARGVEDRKLVLAGLANVPDPAAIKVVEPFLADAQVKAEAELAMLGIVGGIMGSAPEEAKAAAGRLLAASKNAVVRRQVSRLISNSEKFEDYVMAWQVSGPYVQEGKGKGELFDVAMPPEKADAKGVSWRLLSVDAKSDRPWMFDLLGALGGEHRACYVRTYVYSEKEQAARLEFGVDDGIKMWLNGKLVHSANRGGAAVPGEFKADVTLRQGWNALMLKITQDTGPWEFCLAVRKAAGGKPEGVRVQASPPAE